MPSPSGGSQRLSFIDLLRGWAVIVMIETHVVNATILPAIAESDLFQGLKFINGLVAPSFLFASGLAFAITTRRKLNDYLTFGPALLKQIWRLVFLLGVAYLLHLPKFSYHKLVEETTSRDWIVFAQADVLHCIAVSLLIVQVMLLIFRSERRTYAALGVMTILMLFATPLMWGIDFLESTSPFIAAYLNGLHVSLFPVFPWSVFLFSGILTGYAYLRARDANDAATPGVKENHLMRRMVWLAPAVILFSFALDPFARLVYPTYEYWRYSPSFVLLRLGIVVALCAGMFFYERRRGVSASSPVTLMGRESFLVYTVHLLLIYGNFGSFNFRKWVDHTFGYAEAFAWSIVLIVLMYVLAKVWDRIRKSDPRIKKGVQWSILAGLVLLFFFGRGE